MARMMKKPAPSMGERLRYLRKKRGLSIAEVARRIGCPPGTITRHEREGNFDLYFVELYCREYEIDPNFLFGWESYEISREKYNRLMEKYIEDFWNELTDQKK